MTQARDEKTQESERINCDWPYPNGQMSYKCGCLSSEPEQYGGLELKAKN